MDTITTRRTALATIAMAGLVPTTAIALQTGDRSEWAFALARYQSLSAEFATANTVVDTAQGAYFERRLERPVFKLEVEGDYGRFGKHVLPITIMPDELDDPDREWAIPERIEEFRRELAEYRAVDAAIRRDLKLDELENASLAAMHEQSDALRALIAMPAPDLAAVAEKIAIIMAEYDDTDGTASAVLADVRRFAGEA